MTHTPHRLEVQNISIGYGDKIIMHDLSFQVPHGARVAVVGPNGDGFVPSRGGGTVWRLCWGVAGDGGDGGDRVIG